MGRSGKNGTGPGGGRACMAARGGKVDDLNDCKGGGPRPGWRLRKRQKHVPTERRHLRTLQMRLEKLHGPDLRFFERKSRFIYPLTRLARDYYIYRFSE